MQEMIASSIACKNRKDQEEKTADISYETLSTAATYSWIRKNYKNL